ncbi:MAG: DUF3750 domain-containing protein [Magnetococcales bacterium]|nr:DUF3750 domain-containing protein [Magnetococcales bacterium]
MSLRTLLILGVFLIPAIILVATGEVRFGLNWRTADRSSAGIAPLPQEIPEALVQLYAARAFSWRGLFGVHTWIAIKEKQADHYVVLQVVGWRSWRGLPVVVVQEDVPDRLWFAARPTLLNQLCGPKAERAIPKILAAAQSYPHPDTYRLFPGPNSNTFIAHILRQVPELPLNLPATAIGKDYLPEGALMAAPSTKGGMQFSLLGLAGIAWGPELGVEVHFMGISLGLTHHPPGIRLPFFGQLGQAPSYCQPKRSAEKVTINPG